MSELLVPRTLKLECLAQVRAPVRRQFHVSALGILVAAVGAAGLAGCATQSTITGSTSATTPKAASATTKTAFLKTPSSRTTRVGGSELNPSIPLPGQALLERQSAPDCEFRATPSGNANEDMRMKLDYQQQCYRHAEGIVRTRLDTLQDSVGETIKAVRGR